MGGSRHYHTPAVFGERRSSQIDERDAWWNSVVEEAKGYHGDFVELIAPTLNESTVFLYKRDHLTAPAAFSDPMFEIERLRGKWWVRYIPDSK